MRADVRQLLLGLSPRQRAALLLVDLLGYPSEQAAPSASGRRQCGTWRARTEALSDGRSAGALMQEVFRMATQKVRPESGFVDRQLGHQRKRARNRKVGAVALVAVIGLIGTVVVIRAMNDGVDGRPAGQPTGGSVAREADPIPSLPRGGVEPGRYGYS
jgi:hypothetical protein